MQWLCKELQVKLKQRDEDEKVRYDKNVGPVLELQQGDLVLVKNRSAGSLETPLVGPFRFLRYKDADRYACILENEDGTYFDCSMAHVVPVDSEVMRRRGVV